MPRERQVSGNEKRLAELGALAEIYKSFQGPNIQQAELMQKGQQNETATMLNALGLSQQRAELAQRESAAQAANEIALKQLGLTERDVIGKEALRPLQMRQGEEEILKSQATRELAPQQLGIDTEKNAIERAKLGASAGVEGQKRLVDILQLLTEPGTSPESQALIGTGIQGQPGMEQVSQALAQRETDRKTRIGNALAPGLAMQQHGGQASAPAGPPLPIQNVPGEIFGRSVVDFIPNLANTVNPLAEGALGMLGMKTNLGRVPSWWEAYKRMTTGQ